MASTEETSLPMNPEPVLASIGLPHHPAGNDYLPALGSQSATPVTRRHFEIPLTRGSGHSASPRPSTLL